MISVLVPTWGRPERLAQMIASVFETAAGPVQVIARYCAEDPRAADYDAMHWDERWNAVLDRTSGCQTYGQGIEYLQRIATGDVLFAGADDILFRTPGWDLYVEAIFKAVPDRLLIAYANNGLDREKCEHFFCSRRWIETLGYMVRTEFRHFCVDQWVEELAGAVGRLTFLRDVTVEHMHKKYRKAPDDATYRMVRGGTGWNEADNALYRQLAPQRAADLAKLQAAIG